MAHYRPTSPVFGPKSPAELSDLDCANGLSWINDRYRAWRQQTSDKDTYAALGSYLARVPEKRAACEVREAYLLVAGAGRPPDGTLTTAAMGDWIDAHRCGATSQKPPGYREALFLARLTSGQPLPFPYPMQQLSFSDKHQAIITDAFSNGTRSTQDAEQALQSAVGHALVPWLVQHRNQRPLPEWHAQLETAERRLAIAQRLIEHPDPAALSLLTANQLKHLLGSDDWSAVGHTWIKRQGTTLPKSCHNLLARYALINVARGYCSEFGTDTTRLTTVTSEDQQAALTCVRALPGAVRLALHDRFRRRDGRESTFDQPEERLGYATLVGALTHDQPDRRDASIHYFMDRHGGAADEPWFYDILARITSF